MNGADQMLAARVEDMQRGLADVMSSDEKLMDDLSEDLRVYREGRKPVRPPEKRRRSRGFARFLVAICLGIAGTLAWQSYGEAAKNIIATKAPELGWSPETKQMIASSIQWLGWTKTSPGPETTAAATVAPKAPTAPSLDSTQIQQMMQSLAALQATVAQLAASQDQVAREMDKLESVVGELVMKMPEPPPQLPTTAPARKPPMASRAPTTSGTPIPLH
jgi:hypothetical protein